MTFYPVIGMEIHVQLNTNTKLFCACLNEYNPASPNKNICTFCTGQPGALPVLNQAAVKKALKLGVALKGNIPEQTRWDRKNYFYPDLPAGYQISQYDNPIIEGGELSFYISSTQSSNPEISKVRITRAHLEADAGKLIHTEDKTLVDFNRSGCPLIEIVTEPELTDATQAMAFITELQLLVRYLGISDGDMEKGQMRFDCNLSLQTQEEKTENKLPNYKVEIKNINSIRSLGRAIEYEIKRQAQILESGETPLQQTRGWRDDLNKSVEQRSKEMAHDYRYFPEPDLQILIIKPDDIPTKQDLGILPMEKKSQYLEMGLNLQTASTLLSQSKWGKCFDSVVQLNAEQSQNQDLKNFYKTLSSIITNNLIALEAKIETPLLEKISIEDLLKITKLFSEKRINNQGLVKLLEFLVNSEGRGLQEILESENLIQVWDTSLLEQIVTDVLNNNPKVIEQYKSGKLQVIGFLIGQCMKASKGQGNPEVFKRLLEDKLKN